MAKLDRERLRVALNRGGALEVVKEVNRLGYRRGWFENGLEVITTADGKDWVGLPSFSMREATAFFRQWSLVPVVDMGR